MSQENVDKTRDYIDAYNRRDFDAVTAELHRLLVADGRLDLRRGGTDRPDATIETDPGTLAELLWRGRGITEAERSGELKLQGSRPAAKRFLRLFPPPAIDGG